MFKYFFSLYISIKMAKNNSKENNKKVLFAVIIVLLVAFAIYAFSSSPQFGPKKKVSQSNALPQPPLTDRGAYETIPCGADPKSALIHDFCYPVDSKPVVLFSEVDVTCTKEAYYRGRCDGESSIVIQNEQNACGSVGAITGPAVDKCNAKVQGTLDYYKCGVYPDTCIGMGGVQCSQTHTGPGCHVSSSIGGYGNLSVTTTPAGFCKYTCYYKHPQVIAEGLLEISCVACLSG